MSVSRVVALLTPLFAALAGYVTTQAARLPGAPVLDSGEMTALFVLGASSATAAAVKWLHGRSLHERQEARDEWERSSWGDGEPDTEPERKGPDEPFSIEQLSDIQEEINRARVKRREAIESLRGIVGWHDLETSNAQVRAAIGVLTERLDALEAAPVPRRSETSD